MIEMNSYFVQDQFLHFYDFGLCKTVAFNSTFTRRLYGNG